MPPDEQAMTDGTEGRAPERGTTTGPPGDEPLAKNSRRKDYAGGRHTGPVPPTPETTHVGGWERRGTGAGPIEAKTAIEGLRKVARVVWALRTAPCPFLPAELVTV